VARNWLTYVHGPLMARFNFAPEPQKVPLPTGPWQLILSSAGGADLSAGVLPAHAVAIYGAPTLGRST
jgi:hypothetical protein